MKLLKVPWQKWLDEGERRLRSLIAGRSPSRTCAVGLTSGTWVSPPHSPRRSKRRDWLSWPRAPQRCHRRRRYQPSDPHLPFVAPSACRTGRGGISRDRVRIVVASGAHRASTRWELCAKLGREFVDTLDLVHHVPYENLVDLGCRSSVRQFEQQLLPSG